MKELQIMSHNGHDTLTFDPDSKEEVALVREKFDEIVKTHLLYSTDETGGHTQVKDFDDAFDTADKVVAHRPLVGG